MATTAASEVEAFLASLGLEKYASTLIYNGFYTSLDALRTADYHELVECDVRPVHARLIISNLRNASTAPPTMRSPAGSSAGQAGVVSFLRSIGLENCVQQVIEAGFNSMDLLSQTSMTALLDAGLKPVHARLIVSNLDSASSSGLAGSAPSRNDEDEALAPLVPISLAPALDEAQEPPGSPFKRILVAVLVLAAALASLAYATGMLPSISPSSPPPPPPPPPSLQIVRNVHKAQATPRRRRGKRASNNASR